MSPQLAAALVAAAVSLIVAIITAWATLKVHSIRRERRVNLILPRLDVYKTLWSLMDEVTREFPRTGTEELTTEERNDIAQELHKWYFSDGNGIFLSPKARDHFVETKDRLLEPSCSITFMALLNQFSEMRYLMRKDIGAYEDLSVFERFTNAVLERGRKTETKAGKTETKAGGPIGRRGKGSSAAPSQHRAVDTDLPDAEEEPDAEASDRWYLRNRGQHVQLPLGTISARFRQHKAEDRRGHDGPPLDRQDNPTHQPDKPNS